MISINKNDKMVLRELGKKLVDISNSPEQEQLKKEWTLHNDMIKVAPRVLIYPDTDGAWKEILSNDVCTITDPFLRGIEHSLIMQLTHHKMFKDDTVFEPVIRVNVCGEYTGYTYGAPNENGAWGLQLKNHKNVSEGGSYGLVSALKNEEDLEAFLNHRLDFIVDHKETQRRMEILEDIFGDILKIESTLHPSVLCANLVEELVHLRSLTDLMIDLIDNPEMFHRIMDHMSSEKLRLYRQLEEQGLLHPNNKSHYTGSGGLGYTSQLPSFDSSDQSVRIKDMWGFADAQEFSDVSAEMFAEFVLPYQKRMLNEFGLVSYGCCEKIDKKLDYILTIDNLRRVSVSPWTNIGIAAEKIGRRCIYSRKPNPSMVSHEMDEEEIKRDIKEVLIVAKDCNVEIILKDLRTCGNKPENLIKWVDIAQSLCKGA